MTRHSLTSRFPQIQPLESRRLLAAQIVNGELIATGTEFGDDIELRRTGVDDVRVIFRPGGSTTITSQHTFDLDDFNRIRVLGLDGLDYLHVVDNVTLPNLTLDGGAGIGDILLARNARFVDGEEIRDGSGRLVISFIFGPISHDVHGTSNADRISWTRVNGEDHIEVNSSFSGNLVRTDSGFGRSVYGGAGNDTIIIGDGIGTSSDGVIAGEDGNDFFDIAPTASVQLSGGNGDDVLFARGGPENNELPNVNFPFASGDAGIDSIRMDRQTELNLNLNGIDFENVIEAQGTVFGNDGDNRITVRASNTAGVTVHGAGGDDTLIGGPGPDKLFGDDGEDDLRGNGGADLLDGGFGLDLLDGGAGTDTLVNGENNNLPRFFIQERQLYVYGTFGADTMNAVRTGIDNVRFTVNGTVRTFDMDDFDSIEMYGGPGNDTISAANGIADLRIIGRAGNDRLTGNDLRNFIFGDKGDDTIFGNAGDDFLEGGAGNDAIDGGSGVDQISGGDGDDTLTGGPGQDRSGINGSIRGGLGSDTLFARDGEVDSVSGDGGFEDIDRAQVDPDDFVGGIEEIIP